MARSNWHTIKDANSVTISRRLPARFDVVAETVLHANSSLRVAHQIRQDLWRRLQGIRGFSPVVEVRRDADNLSVRAGGRIDGAIAKSKIEEQISDLLNSPDHRRRWQSFASRREAVRDA